MNYKDAAPLALESGAAAHAVQNLEADDAPLCYDSSPNGAKGIGPVSYIPKGLCHLAQRLRGTSYPGCVATKGSNPNGVVSAQLRTTQPRWG